MIPQPPFASHLTLEEELAAFEQLKPRLAGVWGLITAESDEPRTTVVVPSMTLNQSEMEKIEGVSYYEERLLFLLIRLRNPRARVVYVTSHPIHPAIIDYLLQLLLGIPAGHARARLTMLAANDGSALSLTQKILDRPRLIQRIRYAIPDPSRAYLSVFNATPLERKLAVLLGIPLSGVDPALAPLGTKSGSRRIFRRGGGGLPGGVRRSAPRARGARGARCVAGPAADPPPRHGEAQRQFFGRGQRRVRLSGESDASGVRSRLR